MCEIDFITTKLSQIDENYLEIKFSMEKKIKVKKEAQLQQLKQWPSERIIKEIHEWDGDYDDKYMHII